VHACTPIACTPIACTPIAPTPLVWKNTLLYLISYYDASVKIYIVLSPSDKILPVAALAYLSWFAIFSGNQLKPMTTKVNKCLIVDISLWDRTKNQQTHCHKSSVTSSVNVVLCRNVFGSQKASDCKNFFTKNVSPVYQEGHIPSTATLLFKLQHKF